MFNVGRIKFLGAAEVREGARHGQVVAASRFGLRPTQSMALDELSAGFAISLHHHRGRNQRVEAGGHSGHVGHLPTSPRDQNRQRPGMERPLRQSSGYYGFHPRFRFSYGTTYSGFRFKRPRIRRPIGYKDRYFWLKVVFFKRNPL